MNFLQKEFGSYYFIEKFEVWENRLNGFCLATKVDDLVLWLPNFMQGNAFYNMFLMWIMQAILVWSDAISGKLRVDAFHEFL